MHKRLGDIGCVNLYGFRSNGALKVYGKIKGCLSGFCQFFDLVFESLRVIRTADLRGKIQDLDRLVVEIVFRHYVECSGRMERPVFHG